MFKKINGFTLIEIMIVTSIIMILVSISLPGIIRLMMSSNEANAQATLRIIFEGYESYAAAHGASYPDSFQDLVNSTPPYLNEDYTAVARNGYNFTCVPSGLSGYQCVATPIACGRSGSKIFQVGTGGIQSTLDCN